MKSLLELIKLLYGPKALSQTIGTRTNVISLTNKKFEKYIKTSLNIEEASDAAAVNAYKEMEKLVVDVPKMNDSERLIFEGNLRRTKNKLQSSGLIPPDETAEIVSMGTKEPVSGKGIEKLLEESGQTAKPGTLIGDLESRINRLKSLSKEGMKTEDVLKDFATGQKGMLKLQNEGLVRSTARQIMFNDIKSGKLKVSKEIEDIVSGKASGDPIDSFRKIYGEDALEQLDSLTPELGQLRTEIDAEKLARSKFKFEPDVNRPSGSVSIEEAKKAEQEFGINKSKQAEVIDIKSKASKNVNPDQLIDEYNKNLNLLSQVDEEGGTLIGYQQFQKLQNRNTEIEKILNSIGIKSAPEVKPEGTIIPFKKDDPDKFAGGGSVGLDYLVGGRINYADGTGNTPSITLDSHDKAPENEDKYPIKVGENLGLDIKGRMVSGSSNPNRYVKVKTDERDFSVRGKFNVPGTPLSLTGGIGDIRYKENVDINVPEYNYKENIRNVMKANPSSIGAEYKLGPNSLISGSRDSIDGRDTYNLGYKYGPVSIDYRDSPQGKDVMARLRMPFSKGGLGYLMGE